MNYLGMIGPWQLGLILVIALLIPLLALIDIIKSDFKDNNKLLWILIVLLSNFFGSILYFIIGKKHKI